MALKFVLGAFALATFSVIYITGNQDVLDWPVILGSDAWLYCVPERSAENHSKTDWVKDAAWHMYIERKEADGTWTYVAGAERSNSTSEWRVMVAAGSRYKMFGHGFLGIQNISKSDNNTLYKCTISGSDSIHGVYMEPFEVKLCVMEAKAVQEISNANLTSLCNCSEHSNCTSPMDHIEPPKETSNGNLTSLCNCSEHYNNCTSPVDHIEPPKEKCTGWIVAFLVVLAYPVYCIGHRVVNIAKRIFISCCHWYTHFPPAVAEGETCQDCDSQGDGIVGIMSEDEMELGNGIWDGLD